MLCNFLNFSQFFYTVNFSVVCMFGRKTITLFNNYNERLIWTTKLFSCICEITNCKSRLLKFDWLAGGEDTWLSAARSKSKPMLVFLYHCVSDGNQLFSENFACNFHFILHVMSDKAAFVSGALFCVHRYRGNIDFYHSNSASCWQIIHLHIYAATNSASLWDCGMNAFNCISAIHVIMLV